jgi:hypothetical protein
MAITSQGQDALAERTDERQKLYISRLDHRGLQSLRSSDDAYEKVIQAAMRLENNSPQQQAKYEARLTEIAQHRAAVEAEINGRRNIEAQSKPVTELSNKEIITEVRALHARFDQLSAEYKQSAPAQREHLRDEMKPIMTRENELRQEYTGRAAQAQELSRDQVPEVAYSR